MTALLLALTLGPSAHASTYAAGEVVENAATVDVTPGGFEAVVDIIPTLIPESIAIDDLGDSDGTWCFNYEYSLSNMWVALEVVDASIVPMNGYLQLDVELLIWINDGSDQFELYAEALCIGDTCYGNVDPFTATLSAQIGMEVVTGSDGEPTLDATVTLDTPGYDLSGDDIHLDECWIGTVEDVMNWFGLSFYDLVLSLAGSYLESAIQDFGPEIEEALEDAFSEATIEEEFDVNGIMVDMQLYPGDVEITPAGMRLGMNGMMGTDAQAQCIAAYDPGASTATFTDPPALGTAPAGVSGDYHVGLHLSDDIGNQALYALWRGGLLCYTIDEETFPIDTSMLGLLAGDAFDELFPESKPMIIETRPRAQPTMDFASGHDVGVDIEELGLEFYGELDHRQALIVAMDLEADVGVDLVFDGTTGELVAEVALGGEDVAAAVTDNEFCESATPDIEENFANVFDTIAGGVLDGALEGLAFALPLPRGHGSHRARAGDGRRRGRLAGRLRLDRAGDLRQRRLW